MIWQLDLLLVFLAIISATSAITVKDLLSAVVLLNAFSFFMCLIWAQLGAVDVAFTEASVGAGVSGVFFIATIYITTRRTKD
ncbi:MAG: Na(+)/H(+) antiporter subunit B [Thermodesulfovibrionales bacterium]